MRRFIDRMYRLPLFFALGYPLWWIARWPALERVALAIGGMYGWTTTALLGRKTPPESVREIAERWSRLMPHPRTNFPVVSDDGQTALVEIHIHCPLRGTGDSAACWRAMSFDRALAQRMGGELRVMESQSSSGKPFCRLAIRRAGSDMSDLPAADPRWRTGQPQNDR